MSWRGMQVKDLMKKAHIIDKDITLVHAAKIMTQEGISCLIFLKRGKISGVITERDLIKNFSKRGKVSKIMSKKAVVISPDESIDRALETMRGHGVKRLPVIENKKLVGIIGLTDIAANSDELEEEFFFD
jgi:CBS domain-containing protein